MKKNIVETTLGERIKDRLVELGMSQAQLATKLDIAQGSLTSYINNPDKRMNYTFFLQIAEALDVSYDWLAGESESKKNVNTDISKTTGLTDKSIEKLKKFKHTKIKEGNSKVFDDTFKYFYGYNDYSLIINNLIEHENFEILIEKIRDYINCETIQKLREEIKYNMADEVEKEQLDRMKDEEEIKNINAILGYDISKLNISDKEVIEYKINNIFRDTIKDIFNKLSPETEKKWCLNKEKTKIEIVKEKPKKEDKRGKYKRKEEKNNGNKRSKKE